MARSVADAALMQNVTSGPHPLDHDSLRQKVKLPTVAGSIKGMKIAYSVDLGYVPVEPAVRRNMLKAIEVFRKLGAKVDVIKRFADHHRFSAKDIETFIARCEKRDVAMIVTTEKDFVRFPKMAQSHVPIYFMRVEIEIIKGREIFDRMIRIICEPREVPKPVYGAEMVGLALEE